MRRAAQSSGIRIQPWRIAYTTAWVRSLTASFRRIELMWFFTVCSLIESCVGDLLVRHALGDVVQDLHLARRERREDRGRLLAVDRQRPELLEHPRGDGRLG